MCKQKSRSRIKLQVEVLMDSRCTHIGINQQLVKDKRIQTKQVDFSFKIFNTDDTKNREVTRMALLEVKINGHKEYIEAAVMDLNGMDMFLGYDQLVKHNIKLKKRQNMIHKMSRII